MLAELEQTSATLQAEAAELWLPAGRAALGGDEIDVALERLGRVAADTPAYPQAQFLLGIAHVKQRRARPAIAAFRRMIDASDDAGEAAARLRALGWLSLGRVYSLRRLDPKLVERARAACDGSPELDRILAATAAYAAALAGDRR